ncbi:MAG: hypothetical protein A3H23_05765 [Planctomycetes bacterium RIFCSPLOWO2_12_FULL_40_19]|nr:MAG: hypothetical protein A3H23_05765 [Planctomycetes bacterium RIFCSPLOWO2_12_FULL_40_19]
MLISINLFATANLPQARPVADSIDTCLRAICLPRCGAGTAHRQAVNALHSKVTKKVAAEGSLI